MAFDRTREELREAARRPQAIGMDVRTTYGRDPDGNVLELQEVLSAESPIALRLP